ncbi:hypothetical protein [Parabacteroides sp. FAFU027]|uniref:hypothetical protein n=1 Tax=Parabacteroides sp. FAFU027 TaxID=2922715 RepID=UPI001FB00633|nr:hypothetical protein [Parabacteroides sp. FAFU027]
MYDMNKYCLVVVTLLFMIFLSDCNSKKSLAPSAYSFPLKDLDLNEYSGRCNKTVYEPLEFYVTHNDKRYNLNNYELLIRIEGLIAYKGKYCPLIKVDNLPICIDNNLTQISTIEINAIDSRKKMVYLWNKKESYCLLGHRKIHIKLNCDEDDNYQIKFDNQLFYW